MFSEGLYRKGSVCRWLLAAVLLTVLPAFCADAPAVRPLQTELLAPLDMSRAREGAPILLRVDLDWTGDGCRLRAGSIVQGHVVHFVRRSKTEKTSALQVMFTGADCDGKLSSEYAFTLVALVGPSGSDRQTGQSGVTEAPPLADAPNAIGGGLRSLQTATSLNQFALQPIRSLPSQIVPGQVVDIAHINLSVGTGEGGATVISDSRRDVRLERATSLILAPTSSRRLVAGTGAGAADGKPPTARGVVLSGTGGQMSAQPRDAGTAAAPPVVSTQPEPADQTEICSGVCSVVGSMVSRTGGATFVAASLPIHSLGYAPHEKRPSASFSDETTLTYLDEHNLLCTFDPHALRPRVGEGYDGARTVRAVLIDPSTHSVKRVMEWHVRGNDRYLWRLAGGRVLVHMGHELRLLDAELKPVQAIRVEGPVAYVATSPSSDHIAVGVLKQRYTEAVYRQLQETLAEDPEEDIAVRVFDRDFKLQAEAVQSSKSPVPVLSDNGELRVTKESRNRWKITEYGWDRTEREIATAKSACRPVLSSPEHDLIFAVGCTSSGGRWYRMLRRDGHPLLKGESPSDEIAQSAEGVAAGAFAVRIVRAGKSMNVGQPFNRLDLTKEEIGIYRSSDGASLSAVVTDDFALTQNSYALSPRGDQIALVGKDSISFYAVRTSKP